MSKIKLYQVGFTFNDNARIDNINSYLSTFVPVYSNDSIQYQKIDLNMSIKLDLPQSAVGDADFNYCVINQDNKDFYFFVVGADWRAKSTVSITLSLDTINTYWDDLNWNPNTAITRQHKDRFLNQQDTTNKYIRKIDEFNEDMNPLIDRVSSSAGINDTIFPGKKWYMIYKANEALSPENTTNPVSAMLLSEDSMNVYDAVSNPDLHTTASALFGDYSCLVTGTGLPEDDSSYIIIGSTTFILNKLGDDGVNRQRAILFKKQGTQYHAYSYWYTGDSYPYSYSNFYDAGIYPGNSGMTLHNIRSIHKTPSTDYYWNIHSLGVIDALPEDVINAGSLPAVNTIPYNQFDNSLSTLYKIIELPYCPIELTTAAGKIILPEGCSYNYGYRTLNLTNKTFRRNLTAVNLSSYVTKHLQPAASDNYLGYDYESKLYSSEFLSLALQYDTAILPINLEQALFNVNVQDVSKQKLLVDWALSASMNGEQLLHFDSTMFTYESGSLTDTYMSITKDTSMPILTSGYQEYIRNGYNFDNAMKKQQEKQDQGQLALAITGTVLGSASLAGGVLGGISAGVKGVGTIANAIKNRKRGVLPGGEYDIWNQGRECWAPVIEQGLKQMPGISMTTIAMSTAMNSISSIVSADQAMKSNSAQYANNINKQTASGATVIGTSSVDLFDIYNNGNQIKFVVKRPRQEVLESIAKVLYLNGYACSEQAIPTFNSRYWFNFIRCIPIFNDEQTCVYHKYLEDIKTRFQVGVTVYHSHNGLYDLNQVKENWETWLLE